MLPGFNKTVAYAGFQARVEALSINSKWSTISIALTEWTAGLQVLQKAIFAGCRMVMAGQNKNKGASMSNEKSQNLQDVFLNHVRKKKTPVTVFLVNGVKLQGIVSWFDNFCILLRRDSHSQLVYKHAISTVMPGQPIQLYEEEGEAASEGDDAAPAADANAGRIEETTQSTT